MKCPYCQYTDDRVLDTRIQKDGEIIRRRRECLQCRGRFSTQETLTLFYPFVVKKDGRREEFDKAKLLKGLQAACQKRPISHAQLEQVVERVSKRVLDQGDKEVASVWLGQIIMAELYRLDVVAYVRFASVYHSFDDIREFLDNLSAPRLESDEGGSHEPRV